MSDIGRDLVIKDKDLLLRMDQIIINEKKNQLSQLEVRSNHIKNVELKQIELKMEMLRREISTLETELQRNTAIEIKGEK